MKLNYQSPEAIITFFKEAVKLNELSNPDDGGVQLPDDELES